MVRKKKEAENGAERMIEEKMAKKIRKLVRTISNSRNTVIIIRINNSKSAPKILYNNWQKQDIKRENLKKISMWEKADFPSQ